MTNYFLLCQVANGWIVKNNDNSSFIRTDELPNIHVFNSMDKAADHIVAVVGETRGLSPRATKSNARKRKQ